MLVALIDRTLDPGLRRGDKLIVVPAKPAPSDSIVVIPAKAGIQGRL
jgi:hypothetical protein